MPSLGGFDADGEHTRSNEQTWDIVLVRTFEPWAMGRFCEERKLTVDG